VLDTCRQAHDAQRAEVDAWQKLSAATSFDE
jgi:hypothetical protein